MINAACINYCWNERNCAFNLKMIVFAALFLISVACVSARSCDEKQSEPWSYGGHNGPKKWFKTYPKCKGQMQSPIDVVQENQPKHYGELPRFYGYKIPLRGKVKNNGNTIEIRSTDEVNRAVLIEGKNYTLREIHFHFGSNKRSGSEHVRDGRVVAMEMHLVHKNDNGGIAIFAVLFKELSYNPSIQPIVNAVSEVTYMGDKATIPLGINLSDSLPNCRNTFYRYQGSLTSPPCTEQVIWSVFKYPNVISWDQLEAFKKQHSTSRSVPKDGQCFMANNIRPLQAANRREVRLYNPVCEVVYK